MRFIYKYTPAGKVTKIDSDKNISKVLNAYNYLEALDVILNNDIAVEEGGAAVGAPYAQFTFSEFNLSSYLWQLVVNNLQTLPREFTSAPDFALARAAFFPAGRDGDQRWYNTDRDNFAHLEHILEGFDTSKTNGLKGYLTEEVGRLLPVIKNYLSRKLTVDFKTLTPRFEVEISDISMLEGSQLFAIGRAVNHTMKTKSTDMDHFEASCVWHAKLLYHVLATNKGKAFGLEQLATINCIVEVIGNNLKEVALYANEAKYAKLRDSLSGIFIEQRNSLAHALELKLVDPTILMSIRTKMGLDLDAVPLEAVTKAFAGSLAGVLLSPVPAGAAGVVPMTAAVPAKAESDDEFSAVVGSNASSKKSKAAKGPKFKTKGKVANKVETKEELTEAEFDDLMGQLASITVERDTFSDRSVTKTLSEQFMAKIIPFFNSDEEYIAPEVLNDLLKIINNPAFDPHKNVIVYRMSTVTRKTKHITLNKQEAERSYPFNISAKQKGDMTEGSSPFSKVVSMSNTTLIKAMLETGAMNIDSVKHKACEFYELMNKKDFAIECIDRFPSFFAHLATKPTSVFIKVSAESKSKLVDQTLLESTVMTSNDEVVCALLKIINPLDFDTDHFSKLYSTYLKLNSEYPQNFSKKLIEYARKAAQAKSEDYPQIKVAAIISILLNANLFGAVQILIDKYVESDFLTPKYEGVRLLDSIARGMAGDRDQTSKELVLASREFNLFQMFQEAINAKIALLEEREHPDETGEDLVGAAVLAALPAEVPAEESPALSGCGAPLGEEGAS